MFGLFENDELEIMCKEVIMAYFNVLYQHTSERTGLGMYGLQT
jgi:hypothetical protein